MCGGSTSVSYPGPTPEEQQIEQEQLKNIEQQSSDIQNFKPFVLQQYGLQETTGRDPRKTDLQNQIDAASQSGDIGKMHELQNKYTALGFDGPDINKNNNGEKAVIGYEYTPEQKARNAQLQAAQDQALQLQKAQSDRQAKALAGTLPLSDALINQRDLDFKALREDEASKGNEVMGDTLDNAVAKTTSGQQALESLRKTYGQLANNEQNAAIAQAPLAGVYASQYAASSGNANPGAPTNMYSSLTPSYTAALAPYITQQQGQFQAGATNASNNQSFYNTMVTGLLNGAGRAAGAAAAGG